MKKLVALILMLFAAISLADDITISKGVSSDYRKKIEYDFDIFKKMQFKDEVDPRLLEVLGLDELTNDSAHTWLRDRVSYIVEDQSFKFFSQLLARKQVLVLEKNAQYAEYENEETYFVPAVPADETKANAVVSMSNIGTGIYKLGKDTKQKLSFQMYGGMFKEKISIPVTSPRTGIIQIGEGLFSPGNTVNRKMPYSIANSIIRLATFFHEARHSDGNAKSLGFYHSTCPKGHELAGFSACDENLNGPYTVGALMMKEMAKACEGHCLEFEKETLKIAVLDMFNRVQKTTKRGSHSVDLDATPESL